MDDTDRIEREITVDAPIGRVWLLVSEPGWWIGDGDRSSQTVTRDGDLAIVDDPKYGRYPVLTVASDPPRYVAFRSTEDGEDPHVDPSSLVEFFLTERDGGTVLRVVESGFAHLDGFDVAGNTEGWLIQLGFARRDVESAGA
jgi:uncharacterized protein YndB with AHSA1/START domain